MNFYPYYVVSDELYPTLNAMIETMNEQYKCFVGEMREFGLVHETDRSLPFARLEASFYDDCESSLSLGSNFMDDAPSTDLVKALDPSLTSLPLITPSFSSTPIDTIVSDLALLLSSIQLSARG